MSIESEKGITDPQPSPVSVPESNAISNNEPEHSEVDFLAENLIGGMSEVSEHVVENHIAQQNEQEQQNAAATDKRGDTFNPDIHAVDSDGNPKMTGSGYFAKKRGRKGGSTAKSTIGGVPQNEAQQPSAMDIQKNKQRMAGSAAANSLIMVGMVLGGEEWNPIKNVEHGIDEKNNLETAFADYFEAKGMDDIPAGIALSIAIVGYAAPRFTMPKTQARSKSVFGKIKKWWINRKLKKHGFKADEIKKDEKEG